MAGMETTGITRRSSGGGDDGAEVRSEDEAGRLDRWYGAELV